MDRLTFKEVEQINERQKRISKQTYLMVEFPQVYYKDIQMDIVYFETGGDDVLPHISKPAKAMFYDSNLGMVGF